MKTTYAAVAGLLLIVGAVGMQAAAQDNPGAQNRGGAIQKGREKAAAVVVPDAATSAAPTGADGTGAPQAAAPASAAAATAVAAPPVTTKSISQKGVRRSD